MSLGASGWLATAPLAIPNEIQQLVMIQRFRRMGILPASGRVVGVAQRAARHGPRDISSDPHRMDQTSAGAGLLTTSEFDWNRLKPRGD
jgi:hypothetical protein